MKQFLLFTKKSNNKKIFVNLDKIYSLNLSKVKYEKAKTNKNKNNIDQKENWRYHLVKEMNAKLLRKLIRNTNIKIYRNVWNEIQKNRDINTN